LRTTLNIDDDLIAIAKRLVAGFDPLPAALPGVGISNAEVNALREAKGI